MEGRNIDTIRASEIETQSLVLRDSGGTRRGVLAARDDGSVGLTFYGEGGTLACELLLNPKSKTPVLRMTVGERKVVLFATEEAAVLSIGDGIGEITLAVVPGERYQRITMSHSGKTLFSLMTDDTDTQLSMKDARGKNRVRIYTTSVESHSAVLLYDSSGRVIGGLTP